MNKLLRNIGDSGCQWNRSNWYCPTCKAHGKAPHDEGCDGEWHEISTSARLPRKTASAKTWKKFYDKFVLQLDLREKLAELKKKDEEWKRKSKYKYDYQTYR